MHRPASHYPTCLIAAMLAVLTLTTSSPAQAVVPQPAGIQLLEQRLAVPSTSTGFAGVELWPSGRRAYQVAGVNQLVAYDLDTLGEVARSAPLTTTQFYNGFQTAGVQETMEVDPIGGRVFIASSPGRGLLNLPDPTCGVYTCTKAVYTYDGQTLVRGADIPVGVDIAAFPEVLAMGYAKPRGPGDAAKLFLLASEQAGFVGAVGQDHRDRANQVRLAQLDPVTGKTDYVLRVSACDSQYSAGFADLPNKYVVMRAAAAGPPVLYVGCLGAGGISRVVRIAIDGTDPANSVQQAFAGPREVTAMLADPFSERVLLRSGGSEQAWWVFDGRQSTFVGVIGIGPITPASTVSALDTSSGRLYSIAPPTTSTVVGGSATEGGLLVADIRRTPLPQATPYPVWDKIPKLGLNRIPPVVDPATPARAARVFVRPGTSSSADPFYRLLGDTVPLSLDPEPDDPDRPTVDVPEVEGVTSSNYTGSARGYGARALLVGGFEAMLRDPRADTSLAFKAYTGTGFIEAAEPCGRRTRELTLGSTGPAQLTDQSRSAEAQAAVLDRTSADDAAKVAARCGPAAASAITGSIPGQPSRFGAVSCLSPDPDPAREKSQTADSTLTGFRASVDCTKTSTGSSQAAVGEVGTVTVAEAASRFSVYRDPKRGLVSVVESYARGIDIGGVVKIDSVWASAESWANGRKQPGELKADPNCDLRRSAGSCVRRAVYGVSTPGYSCAPCSDDAALVAGLQRALGSGYEVRLRAPDALLAGGSPGGYKAAIQKRPTEQFSDEVLNGDSLPTVPTLEVVRFADGLNGRGRQVYQFAGTELATTYGIELLPQVPPAPPGDLRIELADVVSKPLAGGIFKVYADDDGDTQVGALDQLIEGGTCVTTEDGTGSCEFKGLPPGPYVVQQTAAPTGYQASADLPLVLESEQLSKAKFKNQKAVGIVEISLADDASPGKPLEGGRFELVADDGDGLVGAGDKSYAECTTDGEGACGFDEVPLGAYVVRQVAAPNDYLKAGDAAFALSKPGETARVGFITGLMGFAGVEGTEATPSTEATVADEVLAEDEPLPEEQPFEEPPPDIGLETTTVEVIIEEGPPPPPPVVVATPISAVTPVDQSGGGTLRRLLGAPAELSRFLARNPGEALLFGATWLLLAGAAVLIVRRRSLAAVALTGEPAFDRALLAQQPQTAPPGDEVTAGAAER